MIKFSNSDNYSVNLSDNANSEGLMIKFGDHDQLQISEKKTVGSFMDNH